MMIPRVREGVRERKRVVGYKEIELSILIG
jgi:hypothetical protein